MKTRPKLLATVLAALCCSIAIGYTQRRTMGVVTKEAPVMLLPEPDRTPLATLREGTVVQVLDAEKQGWYRISFQDSYILGDRVGYIRAEHLTIAGVPKAIVPPPSMAPGRGATPPPDPPDAASGVSGTRIAEAIARGRQMGRSPGLRLLDTGQSWTRLSTGSDTPGSATRFRLLIHTPLSWIEQAAGDAAREQRSFDPKDVTDEMAAPVLRIMIYWEARNAAERATPAVRNLVLRNQAGDQVARPLSTEAFSEHVVRASGGSAVFDGLRFTFSMDALRELRGPAGDRVLFVAVTGADGSEQTLRLTRQHFAQLPM